MTLMQWDESMSVGVAELDDQHKKLIDLINEAYEAIQKNDSHLICDLLEKMREYALLHFGTEEEYLKKYEYPDIQRHKFYHQKFMIDVDDFQKKQYEKTNLSQIFVYLSRWLTQHIMEEDKKYSEFMPQDKAE